MNEVYITRTSSFLPNDPIPNDSMESYLGFINGKPSRSKAIVLRNNGIKQRYYALRTDGTPTHQNAELTAEAIRRLYSDAPASIREVDLLSCGTSSPDQMMPSHGVQVHGYLPETGRIEVVSPSGVCCAGMHALKYAYMAIRTGDARHAVAAGSERFSKLLRADVFHEEAQKLEALEENPYISFEKDFLRWMLSDGAGAVRLSDRPEPGGTNFRIEWMDGTSFANEAEACMYMGCEKMPDGSLKSFKEYNPAELLEHSILSIKQDVRLLGDNIIRLGGMHMADVFSRRQLKPSDIDYFLPHLSSNFFRARLYEGLEAIGLTIPYDTWFVNLPQVGNVGAASIYLMLDELARTRELKSGQKVFLLVPESSRFSYMTSLLTVC